MDAKFDTTNPVLKETLQALEEHDASVWSAVRENLGKVNRQRPEVNVAQIERVVEDGDTVVVPGKVLGAGRIDSDVTVAAFKASSSARRKIEDAGEFMFIQDLIEQNPDGEGVEVVK